MSGPLKIAGSFFGLGSGISLWAYVIVFGIGATGGVSGTWWVAHQRITAITAERDAAKQLADLNGQDAARWKAASDLRDGAITELKTTLDQQSAAVESARADQQKTQAALDKANSDNTALQSEADQLASDLAAEAEKAPGDMRPVGPIVAKRVGELFK